MLHTSYRLKALQVKLIFQNISFTVKPGEVVALVGPSGGGKTSCVNLLEYFYKPASGEVLLDNMPIQLYDHHYLHKQVSYFCHITMSAFCERHMIFVLSVL